MMDNDCYSLTKTPIKICMFDTLAFMFAPQKNVSNPPQFLVLFGEVFVYDGYKRTSDAKSDDSRR